MNFLEERITKDGIVKPGNVLKVDGFLNHRIDVVFVVAIILNLVMPKDQKED